MNIEELSVAGWHRVVRAQDAQSGLNCVISVHDVTLGPACGGCRVFPYASFDDGLNDAKRLSRGMTYKNALGGIPFGGGKAVIFADPRKTKTSEMMRAFGRAIHELDGLYYTAEDSGMSEDDIRLVREETPYAAGAETAGIGGNPSPFTARGVWRGIEAAVRHRHGTDRLDDMRVSILGVGAVGMALAQHLHEAGAKLVVADVNKEALAFAKDKYDATIVAPEEAAGADVDIFAPCALGGSINEQSLPMLKAGIIAGAANNQLKTPEMDIALKERGILYAPDYVINAAGVISVGLEILKQWEVDLLNRKIDRIGETLKDIFERSVNEDRPTGEIADLMAREVIKAGANKKTSAA